MEEYKRDLCEGGVSQLNKNGWIPYVYGMIKMGINQYAKTLVNNQIVKDKELQVYSYCPGFVKTEMTSHMPDKGKMTVEQGI